MTLALVGAVTSEERAYLRSAVHEAGHAVVGIVSGVPVTAVTLEGGANGVGGLCHTGGLAGVDEDATIQFLLAGGLAEAMLFTEAVSMEAGGSRSDYAAAREMLRLMDDVPHRAWRIEIALHRHQALAMRVIRGHWKTIDRVARALVREKILDRAAIEALFDHGLTERAPATGRQGEAIVTEADMLLIVRGLAPTLKSLRARIEELEARPSMQYRGVHSTEVCYRPGDFVTHAGSVWACREAIRARRPAMGVQYGRSR